MRNATKLVGDTNTFASQVLSGDELLALGYKLLPSDPETAKDCLGKAKRLCEGENAAKAAIYEARAYKYLGQDEEGEILIREVLKGKLSTSNKALALLVLAVFQAPKRALQTLRKIKLDELEAGLKARIHNQVARMCGMLGDLDTALIHYAGAALYFEEAGDLNEASHAFNNRAGVFRRLGNYSEAHNSIDLALRMADSDYDFVAEFKDHKAQIYLLENEFVLAEQYASEAVKALQRTQRFPELAEALTTKAKSLYGQRRYLETLNEASKLKALGERLENKKVLFDAEKLLYDAAWDQSSQSHKDAVTLALELSNGSVRKASTFMDVAHTTLREFIKTNLKKI